MTLRRIVGSRAPLPRRVVAQHAVAAARALLGRLLVRDEGDGSHTVVRLVETEAYRQSDPASHSARGRTPATATMFGPPGHLYVYFTYGMHHCCNVSCEPEGTGAAVLLRAAVPLTGVAAIRARRGDRHRERDLLRGPGRLTQGLAITRRHDGVDLLADTSPLRLEQDDWRPDPGRIATGPRVGVRLAPDLSWRFRLAGVPEVSRYTRHPDAAPAAQSPG